MQKDKKLKQFQEAFQGDWVHPINIDIGDLNSPVERQPHPRAVAKNKSNVQSFLESIDSSTFDLIKKYLKDNQGFLDKPLPSKIALYEDIKIIYEFKCGEAEIILNKGKGRESISEKLASTLKRSKSTILDRIKKKLCKLSIEDIHYAIMTNTPFSFDKKDQKSKSTVPSIVNSKVDRQENKRDNFEDGIKVISEEDELGKLGFRPVKAEVKFEPKRPKYGLSDLINDHDRHIASVEKKKRIYKYGKKEIKQRIFIYGNIRTNQIVAFSESKREEFKDNMKQQNKSEIEHLRRKTPEKTRETDKEPNIKEGDPLLKSEQDVAMLKKEEEFLMSKKEEVAPITERKEDAFIQENKEESYIPKMAKVKSFKIQEHQKVEKLEEKEEQTKQENEQPNEVNQEVQFPVTFSFMHQVIPSSPVPEPSKEELDYPQKHKELLYQLNNDEHNLQQLAYDPNMIQDLIWSENEDRLLYEFCLKINYDRQGIYCMLRYKTLPYVLKRCKFLTLSIDEDQIDELKRIKGKIDEQPMDIVDH